MRLLLLHPKVAYRSCGDCQKWQYNEATGETEKLPGTDEPRPRLNPDLVPCKTPVGCPKVSPDAGLELTPQNWDALQFHRECRAVGRFPDDSIVRRNAEIIESVESAIERHERQQLNARLAIVVASLTTGRR